MRTIEVKLFRFEELSDTAKEVARDWWRQCEIEHNSVEDEAWESAQKFAECFGVDLRALYWDRVYSDARYPTLSEEENEEGETVTETVGAFIKRHMPEGEDCPFTGVCYDEELLDTIRKNIDNNSTDDADLRAVLSECFDDLCRSVRSELEYRNEDAQVDESIVANEYEFTVDGKIA